mmetsp:Transcript_43669/g.123424  ORF Transcript_43669/g.123424 Transcript_43669/m.123424 type:complete len:203 (-) Transcript_43669:738-1346(-)
MRATALRPRGLPDQQRGQRSGRPLRVGVAVRGLRARAWQPRGETPAPMVVAELANADEEEALRRALARHAEELRTDHVAQAVPQPDVQGSRKRACRVARLLRMCARAPLEGLVVLRQGHEVLQSHALDASRLQGDHGRESRCPAEDLEVFAQRHDDVADKIQQCPQSRTLAAEHRRLNLPAYVCFCRLRRSEAQDHDGGSGP